MPGDPKTETSDGVEMSCGHVVAPENVHIHAWACREHRMTPSMPGDDKTERCYGWPRTCAHYDDLACFLTEQLKDPAFRAAWMPRQHPPVKRRKVGWRHG